MKQVKRMLAATAALLLCVTLTSPQVALAAWNPGNAVHIDPKVIENSTLAVGTHLIHLSALSDKLYEEASRTAAESGQDTIYYKSELTEGEWFDVAKATKIEDISPSGLSVDNRTIEALYFTYHTKSDGITYDLRTNQPVSVYDIPSPYFIYDLEELQPLKAEYDYELEVGNHGTGYYKLVTQFYKKIDAWVAGNSRVKELDGELSYLDKYMQYLSKNAATSDEISATQRVMDHLDASRRSIVLSYLEPELDVLGGDLSKQTAKTPGKLLESVGTSKARVQKSIGKLMSKIVVDGASVVSSYRYTFYNDLSRSNDYDKSDDALENILTLGQIETSKVTRLIVELAMLEKELTPSATQIYLQRLRAGENSAYSAAVNDGATNDQLLVIAEADYILVCSAQAELEFFIEAMTARLDKTAGVALLDARLVEAKDYYNLVPKGGFKMGSDASVEAHIVFLSRLRNQLLNSNSEADELAADKSDLEDELEGALANNDLVGGNALISKIAELDEKLNRLNANQEATIASLDDQMKNASGDEADQLGAMLEAAKSQAEQGNGALGGKVGELKKNGLAAAANGDWTGVGSSLDGLLDMTDTNPGLALPAISSLHDAMVDMRDVNGNKDFGGLIAKAEKALDNAGQADSGLTDEQLKRLSDWADKLLADGNPYIYVRYNDGGNEYIPCEVVCRYTGMRYLWQQSELTGTMTKKGNYYSFAVDSTKVSRDKGGSKVDQMALTAKWQDTLHLHESYTMDKFNAEAYYIPGTKYGVLLTDEMRAMLAEILGN